MITPDTDPTAVNSEIKFSKLSNGDFRLECQQLNSLFVQGELTRIFAYRQRRLEALLN